MPRALGLITKWGVLDKIQPIPDRAINTHNNQPHRIILALDFRTLKFNAISTIDIFLKSLI